MPAGLRSRLTGPVVLLPLLGLTAVVRLANLVGAPQRVDDEGTYVAQAYAMLHLGGVTHYDYWYDHPPVGWAHIAGWFALTGPTADAVASARSFMVIIAVVTAALLWVLVGRLGYGLVTAGAAVAVMAMSPLAVQFQRSVYLDNIAAMWLLATLVLLCSPLRRPAAYVGAGACFAVAVLTKETAVLFLPAVGWLAWQRADPATRRGALTAAGVAFTVLVGIYPAVAAARSELLPGDHVSLVNGIRIQLVDRPSGGSVLVDGTSNAATFSGWLSLDAALLTAGLVAALVALGVRTLRPLAAGFLVPAAVVLRDGFLPAAYVIVLIPLAALLVATVVADAVDVLRHGGRSWLRLGSAVVLALAIAAIAVAVPRWQGGLDYLIRNDLDAPVRDARAWLLVNASRDDRIIVDDALWVDLVEAGWPRENVVWVWKVDTEPAVLARSPRGFRDYDLVVSTETVRQVPESSEQVTAAMRASVPVVTFGSGRERVEIRRIPPEQPATVGAN